MKKSPVLKPLSCQNDTPYLINEAIIRRWTKNEAWNICPISGQKKHHDHWIAPLEYDQLNEIEPGLGAKATYAVRHLFFELAKKAHEEKMLPPVDVSVMAHFANDLLEKAPNMTAIEMNVILAKEFGERAGIKSITNRALDTQLKKKYCELFNDWLQEKDNQACFLINEEIIKKFVQAIQPDQVNTCKEAARNCLIPLKKTGKLKTLIFEHHVRAVKLWFEANPTLTNLCQLEKIIKLPGNEFLNFPMLKSAFCSEREKRQKNPTKK